MYLTSAAVPGGVSGGCSRARNVALPENFADAHLILGCRVKALSVVKMRVRTQRNNDLCLQYLACSEWKTAVGCVGPCRLKRNQVLLLLQSHTI